MTESHCPNFYIERKVKQNVERRESELNNLPFFKILKLLVIDEPPLEHYTEKPIV